MVGNGVSKKMKKCQSKKLTLQEKRAPLSLSLSAELYIEIVTCIKGLWSCCWNMGDDGSGQMGFQHNSERMLNCPSSGMNTIPLPERILGVGMRSGFCGPGWNPIVSLSKYENFGASSMVSHSEFASVPFPLLLGIGSTPHLAHYPSDLNLAEMVPKLPVFGSRNFSDMDNSYGLTGCGQTSNAVCHSSYSLSKSGVIEKPPRDAQTQGVCQISEERAMGTLPNGKRRASDPTSPINPDKNVDGDSQKDLSRGTAEQDEPDEKKQKIEQNAGAKQTTKQAKENSMGGDASKANYIHVRARRGQATNSHSLAERVRREKISERMRLLQELVPGCNKITGKAVMLDEIINYVQSLQQQVEFLSMKLATVNPELNFDIERLLSKDFLNPRGGGTSILGFNPGMTSSHPYSQGFHQGTLSGIPTTTSQYCPLSQTVWDSDLQSLLHMGFDPNSTVGNLGPNGSTKPEL
ncbi:hypothetical protein Ancab_028793 [Ancistrocladus abbreviatus]